jgi:hypothetical protein
MAKGNERDDSAGGIGQGGPQRGDIGGGTGAARSPGGGSGSEGDEGPGEGGQRHPGGSSRDSEKLS